MAKFADIKKQIAGLQLSQEDKVAVQQWLKERGHNLGTTGKNKNGIDGIWGDGFTYPALQAELAKDKQLDIRTIILEANGKTKAVAVDQGVISGQGDKNPVGGKGVEPAFDITPTIEPPVQSDDLLYKGFIDGNVGGIDGKGSVGAKGEILVNKGSFTGHAAGSQRFTQDGLYVSTQTYTGSPQSINPHAVLAPGDNTSAELSMAINNLRNSGVGIVGGANFNQGSVDGNGKQYELGQAYLMGTIQNAMGNDSTLAAGVTGVKVNGENSIGGGVAGSKTFRSDDEKYTTSIAADGHLTGLGGGGNVTVSNVSETASGNWALQTSGQANYLDHGNVFNSQRFGGELRLEHVKGYHGAVSHNQSDISSTFRGNPQVSQTSSITEVKLGKTMEGVFRGRADGVVEVTGAYLKVNDYNTTQAALQGALKFRNSNVSIYGKVFHDFKLKETGAIGGTNISFGNVATPAEVNAAQERIISSYQRDIESWATGRGHKGLTAEQFRGSMTEDQNTEWHPDTVTTQSGRTIDHKELTGYSSRSSAYDYASNPGALDNDYKRQFGYENKRPTVTNITMDKSGHTRYTTADMQNTVLFNEAVKRSASSLGGNSKFKQLASSIGATEYVGEGLHYRSAELVGTTTGVALSRSKEDYANLDTLRGGNPKERSEGIAELQAVLKSEKLYSGPIDGVASKGGATERAFKTFSDRAAQNGESVSDAVARIAPTATYTYSHGSMVEINHGRQERPTGSTQITLTQGSSTDTIDATTGKGKNIVGEATQMLKQTGLQEGQFQIISIEQTKKFDHDAMIERAKTNSMAATKKSTTTITYYDERDQSVKTTTTTVTGTPIGPNVGYQINPPKEPPQTPKPPTPTPTTPTPEGPCHGCEGPKEELKEEKESDQIDVKVDEKQSIIPAAQQIAMSPTQIPTLAQLAQKRAAAKDESGIA